MISFDNILSNKLTKIQIKNDVLTLLDKIGTLPSDILGDSCYYTI